MFNCAVRLQNLDFISLFVYTHFLHLLLTRLIKHTKQLLEENEERLCIKVLQTLREMMTKDRGYGEKVCTFCVQVVVSSIHPHKIKLFARISGYTVPPELNLLEDSKIKSNIMSKRMSSLCLWSPYSVLNDPYMQSPSLFL